MKKGFTLIELLVVIAIIGVLSSVVLASLNSARGKGSNAAVKSGMANMRAQAELYYGTSDGYDGVCTNTSTGINKMLGQATSTGGGPSDALSTYCEDNASGWSAYSKLAVTESGSKSYWCVGSSGLSIGTTSLPAVMAADSCQ